MKNFFKNFTPFFLNKGNRRYTLVIIFLIVYFGVFYFISVRKYQEFFIDQKYHAQELASSSGANSIKIFLNLAKKSLLLLSRDPSIINQTPQIQESLNEFSSDWANTPIIGVARIDKTGLLRFYANNIGEEFEGVIGQYSVSDTAYFKWAQNSQVGNVYLGKPLLPRVKTPQLQFVIPVLTPIYKDGEFDGALLFAISLPKLTSAYLDPLEVSPNSRAYLIHSDSTIVATISGDEGLMGLNYFKYLKENPYPESEDTLNAFSKALKDENDGRLDVILYSIPRKGFARFLIAYSPVIIDNEHWTLALAVPFDDVDKELAPFKDRGIMFILVFFVILITISLIGTLFTNMVRRINAFRLKKQNTRYP